MHTAKSLSRRALQIVRETPLPAAMIGSCSTAGTTAVQQWNTAGEGRADRCKGGWMVKWQQEWQSWMKWQLRVVRNPGRPRTSSPPLPPPPPSRHPRHVGYLPTARSAQRWEYFCAGLAGPWGCHWLRMQRWLARQTPSGFGRAMELSPCPPLVLCLPVLARAGGASSDAHTGGSSARRGNTVEKQSCYQGQRLSSSIGRNVSHCIYRETYSTLHSNVTTFPREREVRTPSWQGCGVACCPSSVRRVGRPCRSCAPHHRKHQKGGAGHAHPTRRD